MPYSPGLRSCPTSRGSPCSTSVPGREVPFLASKQEPAASWHSTTTPGGRYWRPARATGKNASQTGYCLITRGDETEFWQPDLPGRRGFEFAAATLGSMVEPLMADFQTVDLELGQFDIVFYLSVLYHMKEPLTCLERVRAVTKEVAVIETRRCAYRGSTTGRCSSFTPGAHCKPTSGTGTCRPSTRCTTSARCWVLRSAHGHRAARHSETATRIPTATRALDRADHDPPALGTKQELSRRCIRLHLDQGLRHSSPVPCSGQTHPAVRLRPPLPPGGPRGHRPSRHPGEAPRPRIAIRRDHSSRSAMSNIRSSLPPLTGLSITPDTASQSPYNSCDCRPPDALVALAHGCTFKGRTS